MAKFVTSFVPPKGSGDTLGPEWILPKVVREVIPDDAEAEKFLRFGIDSYESVLVAHVGEVVLGIQLVDWDEHEGEVHLGKQMLSAALQGDEAAAFRLEFREQALGRYEDLY